MDIDAVRGSSCSDEGVYNKMINDGDFAEVRVTLRRVTRDASSVC